MSPTAVNDAVNQVRREFADDGRRVRQRHTFGADGVDTDNNPVVRGRPGTRHACAAGNGQLQQQDWHLHLHAGGRTKQGVVTSSPITIIDGDGDPSTASGRHHSRTPASTPSGTRGSGRARTTTAWRAATRQRAPATSTPMPAKRPRLILSEPVFHGDIDGDCGGDTGTADLFATMHGTARHGRHGNCQLQLGALGTAR